MPRYIKCPVCNSELIITNNDKEVKCPICGHLLVENKEKN